MAKDIFKNLKQNLFSFLKFNKKQKKRRQPIVISNSENDLNNHYRYFNKEQILRLKITNFYNCTSYKQIRRATNNIFKNDFNLPITFSPEEIRAAIGDEKPIITQEVTSAFFASHVFENIDRDLKKYLYSECIRYYRYLDDIFLMGKEQACKKSLSYIYEELKKYNFTLECASDYLSIRDKKKIKFILSNYLDSLYIKQLSNNLSYRMIDSGTIRTYVKYIKYVDELFYNKIRSHIKKYVEEQGLENSDNILELIGF